MTLATQAAAAADAALTPKVQQQIIVSAIAISSEPANTPDHANRVALALRVTNNPGAFASVFQQAIASQGIDNTSTDVQIANVVAAVWNAISG